MNLVVQFRDQVSAYIEGRSSLASLRGWLADHVQDIADAGDPQLNELDGLVWILISEYDCAHRDEASVKVALEESLRTSIVAPRQA